MNDPRQPAPTPTAPRPPSATHPQQGNSHPPQAPHGPHAPHAPHPATPQSTHPPGMMPSGPRPALRPAGAPQPPAQHAPQRPAPAPGGGAKIAAMPTMAPPAHDEDAIALIEDGDDAQVLHSKIKAFGTSEVARTTKWKRTPCVHGQGGPVRVRTFHAKLSDQGLEYLDEAINHFIDDHPEVDVKFVTTNVGMFDGKFKDLALVVNVWY